ncbi:MAG: serine/threonine protein kinase [Rhodocyclales bacterium]|nr:serine/threonine protein kinase [Rhodocyclales bacterium]
MKTSFDRARLVLLGLLLALLGIGLWAYHGVGSSLREIRATGLATLLNTQVGTLEQWVAERRHEAEQLATDEELGPQVQGLALGRGGDPIRITRAVLDRAASIGITAVLLVAPDGRILAASETERMGSRVSADFQAHMAAALRGASVFVRPNLGAGRTPGRAWMATPVRIAGGKVVAVLALGSPLAKGFGDLFSAARPGQSGEALAFDAEGWLLSPSRNALELEQRGLAPRLQLPASEQATLLAQQAVAAMAKGGHGLLLNPYPGYLGRDVIGAWRWLHELGIGVAIEIEASEAYAPLFYLQAGFIVVLLLLFAVWLAGFLAPGSLAALLRRESQKQMGPYRLLRQIGEGAISNVYLAQHRMLKRPAAVKVLKQQATTEEWTARFQREVQLSSSLHHPNTISIYDYGTGPGGEFWYAMEYLEGLSLSDLVERYGPVPPSRTAHILRQACASLWEAHSCGLVHRDIKPQNLMLCDIRGERDVVKVLDFGLVKQIGGEDTRDLTAHMRILGTPLYMSPERIRNPADADARADIYALGAVGFFLLTGKRLFETETEHDLTYHVLHETPRLASECSPFAVPVELDALIGRCLEKEAAKRPQTIAEMASALDGVLVHQPWRRDQIEAWWQQNWVAETDPGRRFTAPTK